jgi:hypothetical protein
MQGRRLPDSHRVVAGFAHGDYQKVTHADGTEHWWACPPRGAVGVLDDHQVSENEDGTITVSPSILMPSDNPAGEWHGYLERGIWREV